MENKLATIIIPHHNRHDKLKNLLDCLDNTLFNIIVVSGGSFSQNCNKGAKKSFTDKLIFLNDDTLPFNEDLIKICNALEEYNIVGSTQFAKDNKKYFGIGIEIIDNFYTHRIQLSHGNNILPSGFCFGIKKTDWEKLGGFNEKFRTGNEDVDFGMRAIDLKMKMIILDLEIKHEESQSKDRFKYCKENNDLFESMYSQKTLEEVYNNSVDIVGNLEKKLKILISCSSMVDLSGSPVYNYTLAKELALQGHFVHFYSLWGKNFNDLDSLNITRLYSTEFEEYDLALLSQPISENILSKIKAKTIINIIHSEYDCESPIINNRISHYIAIRPSIKEHLISQHGISEDKITVIFNGIDFNKFNKEKRKKHKENYTKVVLPCTFDLLRIPFIEYYTKKASKDFRVFLIGKNYSNDFYKNEFVTIHEEVEDIENYICDADCVAGILLGRVNLEAMAMGIPSYIHNPENPSDYYLFELSEREFKRRHDIKNVVHNILEIYRAKESIAFNFEPQIIDNKEVINKNIQNLFSIFYKNNLWGNNESVSGSGSNLLQTETLRNELPKLFSKFNIKSILDIPCGDFYWFSKIDLKNIKYTGADIVPELIEYCKTKYSKDFLILDIINSDLPKVDLVITRDCFPHLSYIEIKKALQNIKNSGSKYLLTTSFTDNSNVDIETGSWRPINLQKEPFNLLNPVFIINENCTENDGFYKDKSMILYKIN